MRIEYITRVPPPLFANEYIDYKYASLADAVTTIGSAVSTLKISTPSFPNGATTTVPNTLTLEFVGGGSLNITTGQSVTIKSDTSNWPIRKIFNNATAGQGEILFTDNRLMSWIYPQWWGAVGDDSVDCAAAFQAMLKLTQYNGSLTWSAILYPARCLPYRDRIDLGGRLFSFLRYAG